MKERDLEAIGKGITADPQHYKDNFNQPIGANNQLTSMHINASASSNHRYSLAPSSGPTDPVYPKRSSLDTNADFEHGLSGGPRAFTGASIEEDCLGSRAHPRGSSLGIGSGPARHMSS